MFGSKVIDGITNQFGTFTVEELTYEGRPARVLFSAPLHAAQAGIPLDGSPRLLFDYNQLFLELASTLKPLDILVLGGGMLTLPMALVTHLPRAEVTAVEINKDLIGLAAKYFGYQPEPRLKVVLADAKDFMQQTKSSFDLIIIDLYDNFTIPKYFLGKEFASLLKLALQENGMVVANCIAATVGDESLPLRQLARSYSDEIGKVRVLKLDKKYMGWLQQNLLVLSGKGIGQVLRSAIEIDLR